MKTAQVALALALACELSVLSMSWAASAGALPKEQHKGSIKWMSGGIGKDQADAMRAIASRYNVRLVMAEARKPSAAFLAAVPVTINDAKGGVLLRIKTDGPFLFLRLPPGSYSVKAEVAGRALTRSFSVKGKGGQQIALIWPKPPGEH